jgi:signal transduction histidine kinase
MRDRLELFGGRLDLTSAPGQGTRLSAVIPAVEAP